MDGRVMRHLQDEDAHAAHVFKAHGVYRTKQDLLSELMAAYGPPQVRRVCMRGAEGAGSGKHAASMRQACCASRLLGCPRAACGPPASSLAHSLRCCVAPLTCLAAPLLLPGPPCPLSHAPLA